MRDLSELEKISSEWKEQGDKYGGDLQEVSNIVSEILSLIKVSDKMGYETITSALITLLVAINEGPDDVAYICKLLYNEYLLTINNPIDEQLNLFNEDGTRVTLADLGIEEEKIVLDKKEEIV